MADESKKDDDKALSEALRNFQPPYMLDGHGVRGPQPNIRPNENENEVRRSDAPPGSVIRPARQAANSENVNSVAPIASLTASLPINFYLSDASTSEGDPPVVSNKVLIRDGKIADGSDSSFPTGMGGDNYVLDIPDPADCIIFAGATFDPKTLVLNSRFLDCSTANDFPESRVEDVNTGFLYWQLGFTYFDGDGVFQVRMSRVGDIWVELIYGSQNGKDALWAGGQIGWLDLDFS